MSAKNLIKILSIFAFLVLFISAGYTEIKLQKLETRISQLEEKINNPELKIVPLK